MLNDQPMTKKFFSDTSANIAVVAAMGMGAILLCVGAALDLTNAVNLKSKLSSSTDNAVLAAAIANSKNPQEMSQIARSSFDANFKLTPDQTLKSFKLLKLPNNEIEVVTVLTYQPNFSKFLGTKTRDIKVSARSILPTLNSLDVALVLDRTGSMAGANLSNLKKASEDFLDDVDSSGADIRVSVIPFSDYVNIGLDYAGEDWLDLPTNNSSGSDVECTMEDASTSTCFNPSTPPPNCQTGTTTQSTNDGTTQRTTTTTITDNGNGSCTVSTRVEETTQNSSSVSTSTVTTSGSSSQISSNWANVTQSTAGNYCTYSPDPSDSSGNLVEECSVTNIVGNWYGCVGSRSGGNNLDVSYNGNKIPPAMELTCGQPIKPLSDDIQAAKAKVESLTASGPTYIPAGLIWGWRSLTATAPLKVQSTPDRMKLVILMTDGQNTVSQSGLFHDGTDYSEANTLTENLCNEIKGSGVKIATMSYSSGSRDSTTTRLLKECASNSDLYFEPRNSKTLKKAFEDAITSTKSIRLIN